VGLSQKKHWLSLGYMGKPQAERERQSIMSQVRPHMESSMAKAWREQRRHRTSRKTFELTLDVISRIPGEV